MTHKPYRRSPRAPFITSTLQQEAGRKLRFSSKRTMSVAQHLYEEGWITYMRTDSTTLSEQALSAARAQASAMYGPAYVPAAPRHYNKKVKNAQEAHEAIRPAGETFRTPDEAARSLSGDELRLYDLIWKRTVASQMSDATGTSAQVRLTGVATVDGASRPVEFGASGTVIEFPGFQRAYVEGEDDPEAELADREVHLPPMAEGDPASLSAVDPGGHATQPPARYTEASLVKAMEEIGVGRPSTYASIVSTILDRGYVWKKGSAMVPSLTAFGVVGLLEQHFADLVDYGLTASMEDDLDEIAGGDEDMERWLGDFWFGPGGHGGLRDQVADNLDAIDAAAVNAVPIGTAADGQEIVARSGKYGPYLKKGDQTVSIPDDLAPDELTVEKAEELLAAPSSDRVLGTDPETGLEVQVKAGRFGPYVQLGELVDGGPKPRTSSLFASMSPATLTFEQALELLRIPRVVGTDPADGQEIVAYNGKFGPYLKKGTDSRSLLTEDQLLTVGGGRGPGPLRPAQDPGPQRQGPAPRDGARPRHGPAHGGQGRPLRPLRDRRHDQRVAPTGRRRRGPHRRARRRAAGRAPGGRAVEEAGGQEEGPGQEVDGQEEGPGQEGRSEEGPGQEGRGEQGGGQGRAGRGGPEHRRRRVTGPRGRLVALEGIDGCGKSTQARILADRLGAVVHLRAGRHPARGLAAHAPPRP